jgi:hypothetical protein
LPLVGAPTFSPGILTADQLNSLVALLEDKFSGGIVTADLSWPMTAGGNIDMVQFEILNLYKLWNVRNLAERDSGTTLQDVFDDVVADGGGVVLLPAGSTEIIGTDGIEVGPNTLVVGQGWSSVFATSGSATNHLFHNAAAGDSNISFMNLKIDNTNGSGSFDALGFNRIAKMKLVDVWLLIGNQNGLSFETNSAGNPSQDIKLDRCRLDMESSSSLIFADDVKNLKVTNSDINLEAGRALTYTAKAAGSFGEAICFSGNRVVLDDAHTFTTGSAVIGLTGGSTHGLDMCRVEGNEIECGAAVVDGMVIDVANSLGAGPYINDNMIDAASSTGVAIRAQTCTGLQVKDNDVYIAGTASIGILIGGTARSGSETGCTNFTVSDNEVIADETCIVLVHPGSGTSFGSSVISGNVGEAIDGSFAEFEIWNLGAEPTTYIFQLVISNNIAISTSSTAGWINYVAMGTNRGGNAGAANDSDLIVIGNIMNGTLFHDSNANTDFFNTSSASGAQGFQNVGNVI